MGVVAGLARLLQAALWLPVVVLWLTAWTGPLAASEIPTLRITRIQEINDATDPFARISIEYELANETDRDFCLLLRYDRDDSAVEIDEAANAMAYGDLEIQLPSGEYAPPLTGFPDTYFPDGQALARYGLLRFKAHSRAAKKRIISDDETPLDRAPTRYRIVTEGIWCDAVQRYRLKPPFTYFEVNTSLVETMVRQDGKPAILGLPPEEEVYFASHPTPPLMVKE